MTPQNLDPAQVERAVEGHQKDIEQLLRQLEPELRASVTIPARWRRSLDVDDVLQVSYMETFLRIGTLRDITPAGLRAWMRRIIQNNLVDAIRGLDRDKRPDPNHRVTNAKDGQSARTLLGSVAGDSPTAGAVASQKEQIERLMEAVDLLPPSYRRVIQSVDLECRTVAEVAQEMERSPGAVHLLHSRAHDRLTELMR